MRRRAECVHCLLCSILYILITFVWKGLNPPIPCWSGWPWGSWTWFKSLEQLLFLRAQVSERRPRYRRLCFIKWVWLSDMGICSSCKWYTVPYLWDMDLSFHIFWSFLCSWESSFMQILLEMPELEMPQEELMGQIQSPLPSREVLSLAIVDLESGL